MNSMDNTKMEIVNKLLYEHEDNRIIIKKLEEIKDSEILHIYSYNYNWDDGFLIPNTIIENKFCDLATALLLFYNCDGETYLFDKEINKKEISNDWHNFISKLYNNINALYYNSNGIKFTVPLTKVQKFKLKNFLDEKDNIFICDIPGENIDIEI